MSKPVYRKDAVYQTFNLKEMFGVDLKDMPEIREAIGQAIVEKIVARTESGKAIGGNRDLAPYSEAYAKSLAFKAAGKSKSKVNMTQTGDMLGLMDIIEQSRNTVTVGWDDETENAKAYNHNTGDTVRKRQFFGLSKAEIKDIIRQFKPEVQLARREMKEHGKHADTEAALRIIEQIKELDDE